MIEDDASYIVTGSLSLEHNVIM